jgi:hypothetical protein
MTTTTEDSSSSRQQQLLRLVWRISSTVLVASTVAFVAFLLAPLSWAPNTTGGLLGEAPIRSLADAYSYADTAVQEALDIWSEPQSNWQVLTLTNDTDTDTSSSLSLVVEGRRITEGPFATSGVLLTRANGILPANNRYSADEVFAFLTSIEGFLVIDPFSDPDDFSKYVERYPGWREGPNASVNAKLEVADAALHLPPPMSERRFVVLNAMDPTSRIFVSKSVLHKDRPGASVFFDKDDDEFSEHSEDGGRMVRVINTFAVQIHPLESGRLSVQMINFIADGIIHSSFVNWVDYAFFPGLFGRLIDALDNK